MQAWRRSDELTLLCTNSDDSNMAISTLPNQSGAVREIRYHATGKLSHSKYAFQGYALFGWRNLHTDILITSLRKHGGDICSKI